MLVKTFPPMAKLLFKATPPPHPVVQWLFVVTEVLFLLFDLGLWFQMLAEECKPTEKTVQGCVWCSLWWHCCFNSKNRLFLLKQQAAAGLYQIEMWPEPVAHWFVVQLEKFYWHATVALLSKYFPPLSLFCSDCMQMLTKISSHFLSVGVQRAVCLEWGCRPLSAAEKVRRCEWISSVCVQGERQYKILLRSGEMAPA